MKDAQLTISQRDAEIVKLTLDGLSAKKVHDRLGLDISVRQVQAIAAKYVGPVRDARHSLENEIQSLRPYIEICFAILGKDPYVCELCGERQTKKCEIHHTRYEGATIYDLQYVCHGCNQSRMNKGLE